MPLLAKPCECWTRTQIMSSMQRSRMRWVPAARYGEHGEKFVVEYMPADHSFLETVLWMAAAF